MGGMVHSFNYNNNFGDYGATIILLHQLDGLPFYTLYGHLSLRDIDHLSEGQYVIRGEEIAHFGHLKKMATGHHICIFRSSMIWERFVVIIPVCVKFRKNQNG